MNILFLTLVNVNSIYDRGIYTDLLRYFASQGHCVTIVTPKERRYKTATNIRVEKGVRILQVKTFNIQKTSFVEKGLGTLAIEYQYLAAIRKYIQDTKFDLVLYSTPPITFGKVIKAIRNRDGATSYLLLKDIFPQNAVDLGMIKRGGMLHRFFRHKERQLFRLSDYIGCMSPANVKYILQHNPQINPECIEVNPNCIELINSKKETTALGQIRKKHALPIDKTLFVYGGNLGKPQGIDFLLQTIESCCNIHDAYFLVVGSGTEYKRINRWFDNVNPVNARLMNALPKEDYDQLVSACDVGLIFLDPRFTIPNFPSRLLSYMESHMPVIAATDPNTDVGDIAEANSFGFKVISGEIDTMVQVVAKLATDHQMIKQMGENGYQYLLENYTTQHSYDTIMKHFPQFQLEKNN